MRRVLKKPAAKPSPGQAHDIVLSQDAGSGEALLNAMKGQIFESPRGPMFIDAQTRDVVHNIYIRKVEKVNGQLYNTEFETIKDVKDPGKNK